MSAWEDVPTGAVLEDLDTWAEADLDDYFRGVYKDLREWYRDRGRHDRDGFFAEFAYSDACREAGHPQASADGEDPLRAAGDHVSGWDGHIICLATKYGVACSECEGEDCPYLVEFTGLWALRGISVDAEELAHA